MQKDFLGVHRLVDFLDILGYPEDTHKDVIDLIVEKVEAELPREVCWLPYTSELIGEYGKFYDFTEEDVKELIDEKCGEVREETADLQED